MSLGTFEIDSLAAKLGAMPYLPGLATTIPQWAATASFNPTSGTMYMSGIFLPAGITVTNITAFTNAQAGITSTDFWFALYRNDLTLMSQSQDDTLSTNFAADVKVTKALLVAQKITNSGLYYIALMQAAATAASFVHHGHATAGDGSRGEVPILSGESTTGLTTTAPAIAAALPTTGTRAFRFYAYVT